MAGKTAQPRPAKGVVGRENGQEDRGCEGGQRWRRWMGQEGGWLRSPSGRSEKPTGLRFDGIASSSDAFRRRRLSFHHV